ncbi:MAG: peptide transporter ATP-binding protein [Acidimicrobiales bacterium]|nr:peptide transporter ATP-binding protein [Acidimicrobiales bacterium]
MSDLLVATDFSKRFAGRRRRAANAVHAVQGVSLRVTQGETLAVVGESGAGKSTLGLMLLRLLEPDQGRLEFDGQDVRAMGRRELRQWRRHAQMIFQDPFGSFDPRMTIEASLAEPLVIHTDLDRAHRSELVQGLLERVGLDTDVLQRLPHEFSGGQLQRLAIARAIATKPRLVVCDEPVAALDVSVRAQVLNLLRSLQQETGMAMIFISHDLSVVRVVSDRIAVMYKGRIVEMGSTAEIYHNPRHPYTQALLSAVPVPNPTVQRRRPKVIVPLSPALSPEGCAFALRCPHAMDRCRVERPELQPAGDAVTACHLYDPGGPGAASAVSLDASVGDTTKISRVEVSQE